MTPMARVRSSLAIVSMSLALLAAVVGIALGAEGTLEEVGGLALRPSDPPALLAPITESGRTGWDCAPEHAAVAVTAKAAELPQSTR
jgi:hypothetical protein